MILLTIPLMAPICKELGVDLIWLGVYVTLLVQIGQITPPMGLNLFMVQSVDRSAELSDIIKGALPYLFIMVFFCAVLIAFPGMTAWLPNLMNG